MKIYLAARYSRREELCEYRELLHEIGHTVTSRWLDGEHQALDNCATDEEAQRFAEDDLRDLMAADTLICFTEPSRSANSRGGRHVEFGVALGLMVAGRKRHRIIVVGPRENVFYCLPAIEQHKVWNGAIRRIKADTFVAPRKASR